MEPLEWLVIGGGPTGTCAVGWLLGKKLSVGWVDPSFSSQGRLGKYGSVPANTRNDRLLDAFQSIDDFEFQKHQAERSGDKLSTEKLMETSKLQFSLDVLRDASASMRARGKLKFCKEDLITKLVGDGMCWTAETKKGPLVRAKRVILATGAVPKGPDTDQRQRLTDAGIRIFDHDDVVTPAILKEIDLTGITKLAVIGGSHSGMLAAQNFLEQTKSGEVLVFDRKPEPRFAEERDGWIKYDGTGLKATVADWTRDMLYTTKDPRLRYSQIDDDLVATLRKNAVDAVVFTIGFSAIQPMDILFNGSPVDVTGPKPHNPRNGRLAPGLHGVGIAFPEYWTDEDGYNEPRVGFVCSYLKHLDRLILAVHDEVPPS